MPDDALTTLRDLILDETPRLGPTMTRFPGLAFFRGTECSAPRPGASGSLAVAIVVQGHKRVAVADRELEYGPRQVLVLTQSVAYRSWIVEASERRPYLSMYLAISPTLVADTLVRLGDDRGVPSTNGVGSPTRRAGPVPPEITSTKSTKSAKSAESAKSARSAKSTPTALDDVPAYVTLLDDAVLDAAIRLVRAVDDPVDRTVLAPLVVQEIVFRLLRSEAAAALRAGACRNGDEERISEAMSYVRTHAADRLTVADLARQAAMSPSHFAHRFREVARVTPMQYVKHVRLQEARALLLEPGARAQEVGVRVGYKSPSHFSRDFTAAFGMPPARYAEGMR